MAKATLPQISCEAIDYQGRSLLYFDLVSAIEQLRATKQPNGFVEQIDIDNLKLTDIVFNRTKMRVLFLVDDIGIGGVCYAEPPVIDAANPYYKLIVETGIADAKRSALERHQRAVRLAEQSVGWVDLKRSTVDGVFSSLTTRVFLDSGAFLDTKYTSEELSAALLHELGHIFSFFETMAYTTASNMVLTTAINALQDTSTEPEKIKLIQNTLSVFGGSSSEDVQAVVDASSPQVARTLLLKSVEEAEQNRTRSLSAEHDAPYNTRSIEFMADQFAIRHGAALALASLQHKVAKSTIPDYDRSKAAFYAFQAARLGLLTATIILAPITGSVIALCATMLVSYQAVEDDVNADPSERLARMKADLVQLLKNTKLDQKVRKQLLRDVDAIDALRMEVKENEGIFRFIWRNLNPLGRRRAKTREFQKGLEDLVNNDLFLHASRLRSR